jgi:hypothetical protein
VTAEPSSISAAWRAGSLHGSRRRQAPR